MIIKNIVNQIWKEESYLNYIILWLCVLHLAVTTKIAGHLINYINR